MDFPGNLYPNPDNYPEPSFPEELTAPDIDPDEFPTILVEYGTEWTPVLMAAVDQLLLYSSWAGTHDQKITAVNRASNLKWQLQNPALVGDEEFPPPYWDDEINVDDQAPADEQEWYGQVTNPTAPPDELTFVQNAVIWLLSGFVLVAAAPTIIGAAPAAIFFRTVAVRFTLAFNRGDIREIFRVVIDAVDYGTVDTDALAMGDIIELNVDGLADLPTHDILIVRTTP
jgi:hypothetical protein